VLRGYGRPTSTAMRPRELHTFVASIVILGALFVAIRCAMRRYFPPDT
jgi:hypothetical protein